MTLGLTEIRKFDPAKHPRDHGKFASVRGRQAIMAAPDSVRYGGAPNLSGKLPVRSEPMRSPTRGESWQRIGSKINAIPVHYTGEKTLSRPVGSYLHLTINNQIPKRASVEDHQKHVARFIQLTKDHRKQIIEDATKSRVGKKHVYLKAHEPAAKGVAKWRIKPDKFPENTPPATLHRAYNHAALLAMHDRGLVDYDFKMDDALKDELKPTEPFIRYARQRLNQEANIAMPGQRSAYLDDFGHNREKRKNGEATGQISRRFRPNQQLIKASPFSAVARVAGRAGAALDRAAIPHEAEQEAYASATRTASRVKGLFRSKEPGGANRGGYVIGRTVAQKTKQIAKNPIKYARAAVVEGAHAGSGFGEGIADGFGAGPRTRRAASRIGAVSGAVKIPVIAGAIAAKPVMSLYHLARGPQAPDATGQKLKKFDETKHRRSHTGEFVAGGAAVAGAGGLAAAAPALDRAAQRRGRQRYRQQVTALKAAGGRVMYRGAPKADPNPKPRKFGAVYMTPDKDTARFFAGGRDGAVNRHALAPGAKLLDLHHPDMHRLVSSSERSKLPKDGSEHEWGKTPRLASLTPSHHATLRNLGYAGVEVPQFERHDGYAISNMAATRFLGSGRQGGPLRMAARFARLVKADADEMAKRAPEIAQAIISQTQAGAAA